MGLSDSTSHSGCKALSFTPLPRLREMQILVKMNNAERTTKQGGYRSAAAVTDILLVVTREIRSIVYSVVVGFEGTTELRKPPP